ncbi:hypothetical protein THRCLA_22978 [Thraustotheca clavata]|uniref:Kinesin light chain n=1 Tax=Thraustotheca clavata TaxID=74557 RepID=A0A1V9YKB7_9STRA|nr:hypothetical protein THRCLA_22978 [Thraustotheca clavata]
MKEAELSQEALHAAKVKALVDAQNICDNQVIVRDFNGAYITITDAVKDGVALYGKNALDVVPLYLLMSEIGLELSHLKQVEEILALCIWNIVKAAEALPEGENHPKVLEYRAQVCKWFSLLHAETENYEEAIKQAANGAYYASLLHGPEHIQTSVLYYALGTTFQRMFHTEHALGLYDKIVEIWYKHLIEMNAQITQPSTEENTNQLNNIKVVSKRLLHEGETMLLQILDTRTKVLGAAHIATGEVLYTLGLLRIHLGQRTEAESCMIQALTIYSDALGALHPSTVDVQNVVNQLRD